MRYRRGLWLAASHLVPLGCSALACSVLGCSDGARNARPPQTVAPFQQSPSSAPSASSADTPPARTAASDLPTNPREALPATAPPSGAGSLRRVLLFTRTVGFAHDSIPAGIAAIQKLGMENGFTVDQTADATRFNDATLSDYDVVIFSSTTSDVLDNAQQDAFQRYIQAGGGWVGVHTATDTEYDWP